MKRLALPITLLLAIFLSDSIFAADFDATGLWNYTETPQVDNCEDPDFDPSDGFVIIFQNDDEFLIVDLLEGYSTNGSISSATYNFTDSYCEIYGGVTTDVEFTLSSATSGSGPVNWTWTHNQDSCSGISQLDLTKQPQNTPKYDASGKWNFIQSGFDDQTCDPPPTSPAPSGYFQVTQTGNSVTAIDNQGVSYRGFIDEDTYVLMKTNQVGQARKTTVYRITLSSATSGSGNAEFVWDDNCTDCWGDWTIDVTKVKEAKSITGITILLFKED